MSREYEGCTAWLDISAQAEPDVVVEIMTITGVTRTGGKEKEWVETWFGEIQQYSTEYIVQTKHLIIWLNETLKKALEFLKHHRKLFQQSRIKFRIKLLQSLCSNNEVGEKTNRRLEEFIRETRLGNVLVKKYGISEFGLHKYQTGSYNPYISIGGELGYESAVELFELLLDYERRYLETYAFELV